MVTCPRSQGEDSETPVYSTLFGRWQGVVPLTGRLSQLIIRLAMDLATH